MEIKFIFAALFKKTHKNTLKVSSLSYRSKMANATGREKSWYVVDAEGKTLGRLTSKIAGILRGKHKPTFTPHEDCGDHVIVINAEKIRLTGNKLTAKEYLTHSLYPGGQKSETPRDLLKRKPTAVVERAIKGMLPKTKLGNALFANLHVYAGTEHPHQAQKPQTLNF